MSLQKKKGGDGEGKKMVLVAFFVPQNEPRACPLDKALLLVL